MVHSTATPTITSSNSSSTQKTVTKIAWRDVQPLINNSPSSSSPSSLSEQLVLLGTLRDIPHYALDISTSIYAPNHSSSTSTTRSSSNSNNIVVAPSQLESLISKREGEEYANLRTISATLDKYDAAVLAHVCFL